MVVTSPHTLFSIIYLIAYKFCSFPRISISSAWAIGATFINFVNTGTFSIDFESTIAHEKTNNGISINIGDRLYFVG